MTVDQKGSRRVGDRVDHLLETLRPLAPEDGAGVVRPFERTVGDEVQAVLDEAELAVDLALAILRLTGWSIGIGAGPVDEPLPPSARAGSGPAFVLARSAVERAKVRGRAVPVAVDGVGGTRAGEAEAVLSVLGAILARRTAGGWEVVDAFRSHGPDATQSDVAADLGVTQQAVSQRLRAALWFEEVAVRPVVARLLGEAQVPDGDVLGAADAAGAAAAREAELVGPRTDEDGGMTGGDA